MATDTKDRMDLNQIYIRAEAKLKQDRLVALCSKEIGWVGSVKPYETPQGKIMVVEDIFVPTQVVSSTSVDVEPEDFGIAGLMDRFPESVEFMRYFGHSHVNMGAYFSGTDTGQIDDWRKYGLDWCINHVQNKKGESKTRFDMFEPFHFTLEIPKMEQLVPSSIDKWAREMLEEYVTERAPAVQAGFTGGVNRGSKQGDYTSYVDGWRIEYRDNKVWRRNNFKEKIVELFDENETKIATYSTQDLTPNQQDAKDEKIRKDFISQAAKGRAEGKADSPSSSTGAGVRQLTQTASGAKSEPKGGKSEKSKSGSGTQQTPSQSRSVKRVIDEGDVLDEAAAAQLLYTGEDDDEDEIIVPGLVMSTEDEADSNGVMDNYLRSLVAAEELTASESADLEHELAVMGFGISGYAI